MLGVQEHKHVWKHAPGNLRIGKCLFCKTVRIYFESNEGWHDIGINKGALDGV